jgi:hypothetical protein
MKIKKLEVYNCQSHTYIVGKDGVTEIKDSSKEWEDKIDFIYWIYKGENLAISLENVPVMVEYF